jgi:hypothetical protein
VPRDPNPGECAENGIASERRGGASEKRLRDLWKPPALCHISQTLKRLLRPRQHFLPRMLAKKRRSPSTSGGVASVDGHHADPKSEKLPWL